MEGNKFWLIYIRENQVSVSLASNSQGKFQVVSVGPPKDWDGDNSDVLIASVDESLSVASLNANITEAEEPSIAAFVVPPFWVGSDAKILPQKRKYIKDLCKKLSFTPSGFLAEDEALVEDSNKADGFPSSFILVYLNQNEFYLSLVYLGHIKERIRKSFSNEFNGQLLESTLLELRTESTLPPQIFFFGQVTNDLITSLKNYPWLGKKNIETFLHLPDISLYSDNDLITIFVRVISSQISQDSIKTDLNYQPDFSDSNETEVDSQVSEISVDEPTLPDDTELKLIEASPQDLGFNFVPIETEKQSEISTEEEIIAPQIPEPNLDPFDPPIILPPVLPQEPLLKKKFSFNFFKKNKPFKLKINFNIFWIILIILPFLSLIPFVFASAKVTLFTTPYKFDKTISVTLKTDAVNSDISSAVIPVKKEVFDVDIKEVVQTTGQKTIGEKAKGEIVIYNKLDKIQNIPKGSILTDKSGKKYELTTAVSVVASSSDLDKGVITLGQTKTVAIALDIGPEFNLSSGSQLNFKDYPDTSLIAKAETNFSGGTKEQISAVSQADKTNIQSKIDQGINREVENKINQTLGSVFGIIKETIQSDQSPLDLSREVGEAAEELSGTVTASVSVFTISPSVKEEIIKHFLSDQVDFDKINLNPDSYSLNFKVSKISSNQATASLNISGQSLPKVDITALQKTLSIKTIKQAENTIKKLVTRAYDFNIENNLPLLPFNPKNITIEIKSENL